MTDTMERSQAFRPTPPRPVRPTISTLLPSDLAAGKPQTIGDYIVSQIDAGVHPVTAAAAAGVQSSEYLTWMREGQLVVARLNGGAVWETDFTPDQQDMAIFAERAVKAHGSQVARLTVVSEQIARGGIERRSTRTKHVAATGDSPALVETVETVERTLPDAGMVQWRLEHLEPSVYGKKATLAITVHDQTDSSAVADLVAERMAQIVARFTPPAIETTATE